MSGQFALGVSHTTPKTNLESTMIGRVWHGWTKADNADKYERLLREEIFPGIAARKVAGYKGIQLFRRPLDNEIEFITIMWFESWDAVKQFAGEDYQQAYVPPKAREILERFDERSQHYEVKERLEY
jgi:antibiotic biosynthesis monooxygenase (ABM) superfamily enzyme